MRGDERGVVLHRIKGPAPLLKSARALVLRLHRYGRGRARTPGEIKWCARAIDAIDAAVKVMEQPPTDVSAPAPAPRANGTEARS